MKKYIIFAILILLISCDGSNSGPGDVNLEDIYSGTDGIVTTIMEKVLPGKIYEGGEFDFIVKITNLGPIATSARLIVVPEHDYLTFSDGSRYRAHTVTLEGKENYEQVDDFELLEFKIQADTLEPLSEVHNAIISMTTCYDYTSKLFTTTCIDTDPFDKRPDEPPCRPQVQTFSGQGGPVSISKIEPFTTTSGNSVNPQFKIYITNTNPSGSVTRYGQIDKYCQSSPISFSDYNRIPTSSIDITLSDYGRENFDCIPEELVLKGNEDYFICTLNTGISQDVESYQTTLTVELNYGYSISDSASVSVEKFQ